MHNLNVLWAKKPYDADSDKWLPLITHIDDTACTAKLLWEQWASQGIKEQISSGIEGIEQNSENALKVLVFLAYCHDLGKASPVFQDKRSFNSHDLDVAVRRSITDEGFPLYDMYLGDKETRHELVSYAIMQRNNIDKSLAAVVGSHHGMPPSVPKINRINSYERNCGFDSEAWLNAQNNLLSRAVEKSGLGADEITSVKLSRKAQVLLSALIIMADWIASNNELFPLMTYYLPSADDSEKRAQSAMELLKLPTQWMLEPLGTRIYQERFPQIKGSVRPVQTAFLEAVLNAQNPGIFVLEAPMGEGKTEAALAAAEVLAQKRGCRGIYFALPTQATSNAMFERAIAWLGHFDGGKYNVRLSHGKADFNETYEEIWRLSGNMNIDGIGAAATVHQWFSGKKGMLADFAIGTIDHVLMAGLKQKHLMLRHLGLAGKVLVIDECHAYDLYMESYLLKTLNWLGAYGVPVIILSATLPAARRRAVINAYLNKKKKDEQETDWGSSLAYPLITYTDGNDVRSVPVNAGEINPSRNLIVTVEKTDKTMLMDLLTERLSGGGCAGIIVNTVRFAQEIYALAAEHFGEDAVLLHSGFIAADRASKEKDLVSMLGRGSKRPSRKIVIGTQIFEQSMDIDFDVLITQLCPIDLLLQRIGRLHRHNRDNRPQKLSKPVCYVTDAKWGEFDKGSAAVYGSYLLMRTLAVLPDSVSLPDDIPQLVAQVYDELLPVTLPAEVLSDYEKAKSERDSENAIRLEKSKAFQIGSPNLKSTLIGWLDMEVGGVGDETEKRAEAAVRDGEASVEVIVIQKQGQKLKLLPWLGGETALPIAVPDNKTAKQIASCSLHLPSVFGKPWIADKVIKELEERMRLDGIPESWYESYWLKGALFLVLDGDFGAELCGYKLTYSQTTGLVTTKSEV